MKCILRCALALTSDTAHAEMLVLDRCLRPRRKDGARGAPQKLEQVLANPRGVEILIDQTAAEEEQLPDLDST